MTHPLDGAFETVSWAESDGVATITLNRPAVLNALNAAMAEELLELLRRAAGDESVRAVLLTGAGRAFLAGPARRGPDQGRRVVRSQPRRHVEPDRPIALDPREAGGRRVNGPAVGAGIAVALACDLVVASERAVFIGAFDKLGFIPDAGLTWLLPRRLGMPRALQTIYLGEPIDAATAVQLGLVAQVVPHDALLDRAGDISRRLASGPTLAFGATKRACTAAYLATRPPTFNGR